MIYYRSTSGVVIWKWQSKKMYTRKLTSGIFSKNRNGNLYEYIRKWGCGLLVPKEWELEYFVAKWLGMGIFQLKHDTVIWDVNYYTTVGLRVDSVGSILFNLMPVWFIYRVPLSSNVPTLSHPKHLDSDVAWPQAFMRHFRASNGSLCNINGGLSHTLDSCYKLYCSICT